MEKEHLEARKGCRAVGARSTLGGYDGVWLREADHRYFVEHDQESPYVSCSALTSFLWSPFDPSCAKYLVGHKTKNNGAYAHTTTADEVRALWKEWNEAGTAMHLAIERYYRGVLDADDPQRDTLPFKQFLQWERDNPDLEIVAVEKPLASRHGVCKSCGTVDAFARYRSRPYDPETGEELLVIVDWKRSRVMGTPEEEVALRGKYTRYGVRGPAKRYVDCRFNKYGLKLCVYQHMHDTHYGHRRVIERRLVVFHPDLELDNPQTPHRLRYLESKVPYMADLVSFVLAERERRLLLLYELEGGGSLRIIGPVYDECGEVMPPKTRPARSDGGEGHRLKCECPGAEKRGRNLHYTNPDERVMLGETLHGYPVLGVRSVDIGTRNMAISYMELRVTAPNDEALRRPGRKSTPECRVVVLHSAILNVQDDTDEGCAERLLSTLLSPDMDWYRSMAKRGVPCVVERQMDNKSVDGGKKWRAPKVHPKTPVMHALYCVFKSFEYLHAKQYLLRDSQDDEEALVAALEATDGFRGWSGIQKTGLEKSRGAKRKSDVFEVAERILDDSEDFASIVFMRSLYRGKPCEDFCDTVAQGRRFLGDRLEDILKAKRDAYRQCNKRKREEADEKRESKRAKIEVDLRNATSVPHKEEPGSISV